MVREKTFIKILWAFAMLTMVSWAKPGEHRMRPTNLLSLKDKKHFSEIEFRQAQEFRLNMREMMNAAAQGGPSGTTNMADINGFYFDSTHGTQNRKIFQALINAAPAAWEFYFPTTPSGGKVLFDSTIVIDTNIRITGAWGNGKGNYTDYGEVPTVNMFYINNSTDTFFKVLHAGVIFTNIFMLQSTASVTQTGTGVYFADGTECQMTNFGLYYFGRGVEIKEGGAEVFRDGVFWNNKINGITFQDSLNTDDGDQWMIDVGFITSNGQGGGHEFVKYISGGGLNIMHCKANSVGAITTDFIYCPFIADIDMIVSDCATEGVNGAFFHMVLSASPAGSFANLNIHGGYDDGRGVGGHVVLDGSASTGLLTSVSISSFVIYSYTNNDTAYVFNKVQGVSLDAASCPAWQVKRYLVSLNNPFSANNQFTFGNKDQTLAESGRSVPFDFGFGTQANITLTGNDTLRTYPGNDPGAENTLQGAYGTTFTLNVTQDGTGGRKLYVNFTYGVNYTVGYGSFLPIRLLTTPGATTVVHGIINNNGYPTILYSQTFGTNDHAWTLQVPTIVLKNGAGAGAANSFVATSGDQIGATIITTAGTPAASDTVAVISYADAPFVNGSIASVKALIAGQEITGNVAPTYVATATGFIILSNNIALPTGTAITFVWNTGGN